MTLLGEVTLSVRRLVGAWADGVWVDDPPVDFSIVASVQPITPELMDDLQEGDRTSARFVLYVEEGEPELRTVDISGGLRPDRVTYRGRQYILQSIGDWTAHQTGIPSYEYVMLQVGDDEPTY